MHVQVGQNMLVTSAPNNVVDDLSTKLSSCFVSRVMSLSLKVILR